MSRDLAAQPVAGSLTARIIRACPVHHTCALTCKQRRIEDLGEIAAFAISQPSEEFPDVARSDEPSLLERIKRRFFS